MKLLNIICFIALGLSNTSFAADNAATNTNTDTDTATETNTETSIAPAKKESLRPKAPGTAQRRMNPRDEEQGFGRGPQPPSKKKGPGMAGLPPGSMPGSPDANAGALPSTVKVPPPPTAK